MPRNGSTPIDRSSASAAEAATFKGKTEQGKNASAVYSPMLAGRGREKLELESALHKAIERDELVLHYQPKIDLRGARMVGAEALMRWNRNGVLVPPGDFIPLAEETGLILPIGRWVLREACRQLQDWQHDPRSADLTVAVNVSARQFRQPVGLTLRRPLGQRQAARRRKDRPVVHRPHGDGSAGLSKQRNKALMAQVGPGRDGGEEIVEGHERSWR